MSYSCTSTAYELKCNECGKRFGNQPLSACGGARHTVLAILAGQTCRPDLQARCLRCSNTPQ